MYYEIIDHNDLEPTTVKEYYSKNLDTVEDPSDNERFLNLSFLPIDDALGAREIQLKLWYFEPGEEVIYHAHLEQEELFYVLDGEFSLKIGAPDDPEIVSIGPGTFYVAGPETGHGHRCVGDETGVMLAIGAPPGFDPGQNPADVASE